MYILIVHIIVLGSYSRDHRIAKFGASEEQTNVITVLRCRPWPLLLVSSVFNSEL